MRRFLLGMVLVVMMGGGMNPSSIWCDYHGTYLYKRGKEYPGGVCYDTYSHSYYDIGCSCQREHWMAVRCQP